MGILKILYNWTF